jgi:hypothetical protein
VVTVNEDDIREVPGRDASSGKGSIWKSALWGGGRHQRNLVRLQKLLPTTIRRFSKKHDLTLGLGVQLRPHDMVESRRTPAPSLAEKPILEGRALVQSRRCITVPEAALGEPISLEEAYVREGRTAGVALSEAPHVIIGPLYAAFDERDFVVQHPKIALAGPSEREDLLRALSLYIASSIGQYLLFFGSVRWGIDRRDLVLTDVRRLPCPELDDPMEVARLAGAHRELSSRERESSTYLTVRADIDEAISEALGIPEHIAIMAQEFISFKLPMDKGNVPHEAIRKPDAAMLRRYSERLCKELQGFSRAPHISTMFEVDDFVCCRIERPDIASRKTELIDLQNVEALMRLSLARDAQWVYVQRGLRFFESGRYFVCKPAQRMYWSETAAFSDSDDLISEIISFAD